MISLFDDIINMVLIMVIFGAKEISVTFAAIPGRE